MSGLSRTPGKRVRVNSPSGVRIPLSPPEKTSHHCVVAEPLQRRTRTGAPGAERGASRLRGSRGGRSESRGDHGANVDYLTAAVQDPELRGFGIEGVFHPPDVKLRQRSPRYIGREKNEDIVARRHYRFRVVRVHDRSGNRSVRVERDRFQDRGRRHGIIYPAEGQPRAFSSVDDPRALFVDDALATRPFDQQGKGTADSRRKRNRELRARYGRYLFLNVNAGRVAATTTGADESTDATGDQT